LLCEQPLFAHNLDWPCTSVRHPSSPADQNLAVFYDTNQVFRRRRAQLAADADDGDSGEELDWDNEEVDMDEELMEELERLERRHSVYSMLANRDPSTGRLLADVNDIPDYIPQEKRDSAKRRHMFEGRMPLAPWKLVDGRNIMNVFP